MAAQPSRPYVVVLDELAYLTFARSGGQSTGECLKAFTSDRSWASSGSRVQQWTLRRDEKGLQAGKWG
jgi:hypothetical protein